MPAVINAGENVKRSDFFFVDPNCIVVKESLRGRLFPPTEEQVVSLAESIYDNGQRQPVETRKIAENRLELINGFTRCAAGRLIVAGFTGSDGVYRQKIDFLLKTVVVHGVNDELSLLYNIIENVDRTERSLMDDAHNSRRLINDYGYTPSAVAKVYHCSSTRISQLLKLLTLTNVQQKQVHTGELSFSAALHLADVPEERREEVVEKAKEVGGGKVTASAVKSVEREEAIKRRLEKAVDEGHLSVGTQEETVIPPPPTNGELLAVPHILNDDNRETPVTPPVSNGNGNKEKQKTYALTIKEVKDFWVSQTESDNDTVHELSLKVVDWLLGTCGPDELSELLHNLCE